MITINNYILEKLHLNKDIKTNNIFKSVDEIINVFKIKSFGATEIIKRWIVDNKISEVIIYYDKSSDIVDDEYNTTKMIYNNNKVNEYLELIDGKAVSNWKSADNKEIKSHIQFNNFLFFIDSYINVNFLLLKKS
jgi:hypothetical protein